MRESDQILHDDLLEAGLPALAERAAAGEWNDYFGSHDFPQVELVTELRAAPKRYAVAVAVVDRLIGRVQDGKFDGTEAESKEWAVSAEGQAAFRDLLRGGFR